MLNYQVLTGYCKYNQTFACWKWVKNLKTFDLSYFRGKSHFEENGTQNYLVFQPIQKYFKRIVNVGNDNYVYYWKSKGLPDFIN